MTNNPTGREALVLGRFRSCVSLDLWPGCKHKVPIAYPLIDSDASNAAAMQIPYGYALKL